MSRASLIDVYISGLNLTAVAVVSDGRRCRITEGEPAPGETVKHRYFFKTSHAELLLMTIDKEGVTDQAPAALAALIERAAATIGAPYQTPDELRRVAEQAVAEIVERVKASGQSGGLKHWNARYKQYRLARSQKRRKRSPTVPFWSGLS